MGYVWVVGELTLDGRTHPFTLSGMSVVDRDADAINGAGTVYNLKDPADFVGNFVAPGVVVAVGGREVVRVVENRKGVVLDFEPMGTGFGPNVSRDGFSVGWKTATK